MNELKLPEYNIEEIVNKIHFSNRVAKKSLQQIVNANILLKNKIHMQNKDNWDSEIINHYHSALDNTILMLTNSLDYSRTAAICERCKYILEDEVKN